MGKSKKKIWYVGITREGNTEVTNSKPGKHGRFRDAYGPYTKQELQAIKEAKAYWIRDPERR